MRALYILAAAALVLLLIGQVRVGGRAEFNARGFFLWVRLGRLRLRILPMKPKREKTQKKGKKSPEAPAAATKKTAKKADSGKKKKKDKKPKPPAPLPEKLGGALEYARALLPTALEAAGGMLRGMRVDELELELTAGAPDPADAAMLYGRANAALGALWEPLVRTFPVKEGRARVKLDFDAQGMTVYGAAALSIRLGTLVRLGLRAGVKALFGVLAARKRLKNLYS